VAVPRLILVNGPPGVGKSTLARMFAEDHPLSLDLDIDRVRDLLGRWREHAAEAGLLARAVATAAARTHLAAGHDVVVPQYVARIEFIEHLAAVAAGAGARFHELVVLDARGGALRRGAGRGVGAAELATMYDRLLVAVAARPGTRRVTSDEGRPQETYRKVLAALE
jgi:predicted kinase